MRKTCKPPQIVPIVWHSAVIDSVCTADLVHSEHKEENSRTMPQEKKISIAFRDTIPSTGKPILIHLDEID